MRRYLVVANQTLGGEALLAAIRARIERGPCAFHLVVPATPPHEQFAYTERRARDLAQERLDQMIPRIAGLGADVTGEVGDASPMLAIADALLGLEVDEIILSTLPAGASRWLRQDLPHRVERRFERPVAHVVAEREPARA
jgi:hypothetical protein